MRPHREPGILGGEPLCAEPLHIVRPSFPALGSFADDFEQALVTGTVTNDGPHVREFERRLSAYLGAEAVVCNNGQSALMLMLRAAGIDSGKVIVPSYTFSATPHAVRWCGARPVFADIDDSLCLDPARVEPLINERTVAILGVDVYGIACDYEAFAALGRRHGVKVLYDSAPAFGTRVDDVPIGTAGDAQIFSFHATKAMSTMEGGCLVSRDPEILRRARALRNFGQVDGARCDEPGLNAKMTEVCALIGIRQLETLDAVVRHRAACAQRLRQGLAGVPGLAFAEVPNRQLPVWLYFPLIVSDAFGLDRNQLAAALEYENIYARKYFELPCHHLEAYAEYREDRLPETERVARSVLSLPVYNDMTETECDHLVQAITEIQAAAAEVRAALRDRANRRQP